MKKDEFLSVYQTTSLSARLRLAAGHDNAGEHVLVVGYEPDSQHLIGRYLNGLHADGAFYAFDADHLEDVPPQVSADKLAEVFGSRGHPEFSGVKWRYAVRDCLTELGYWDWVAAKVNGRTEAPVMPDLGEDVPTWQVWLPKFRNPGDTPQLLVIIKAQHGRDVVEAVNGRADCAGRWYSSDPAPAGAYCFELPRDQDLLGILLDAEGYQLTPDGRLKV